jgi:hypothetical protein
MAFTAARSLQILAMARGDLRLSQHALLIQLVQLPIRRQSRAAAVVDGHLHLKRARPLVFRAFRSPPSPRTDAPPGTSPGFGLQARCKVWSRAAGVEQVAGPIGQAPMSLRPGSGVGLPALRYRDARIGSGLSP